MLVSVSVLSAYENLLSAINKVNNSTADYLHIDVMDGVFVNNTKFPIDVVKKISAISKKPLDVHLMVNDINTVLEYASIKPDYLTFHVEIIKDNKLIKFIKSLGIKVGLAINPETNINKLKPYLEDIDLVLFMSVTPGAGGQSFKEKTIDKIKRLKKVLPDNVIINIDGGINDKTIEKCKEAGCNMVVSGSFITNNDNYNEGIDKLR